MEKYEFIASTKIEAINQAKKKLVETENNLLIKTLKEEEKEVIIQVIEKREILNFISNYLKELLKNIGYNSIQIEITNKDTTPVFTIYSENDSLLIGKSGKNLKALQTLIINVLRKEKNEFSDTFPRQVRKALFEQSGNWTALVTDHNTDVQSSQIM